MPRIEAIIRTVEARIRPVLLTTVTTVAGLTPMMLGVSIDLFHGGYTVDAPSATWWKPLATAVVFGLTIATGLTLVFTPAMLSIRVWLLKGSYGFTRFLARLALGKRSQTAVDQRLARAVKKIRGVTVQWEQQQLLPDFSPPKAESIPVFVSGGNPSARPNGYGSRCPAGITTECGSNFGAAGHAGFHSNPRKTPRRNEIPKFP